MGIIQKRMVQMKMLLWYSMNGKRCYFCKELLLKTYKASNPQAITVHHINGNHFDNRAANTAFAHSTCHRSHHMKELHREGRLKRKAA